MSLRRTAGLRIVVVRRGRLRTLDSIRCVAGCHGRQTDDLASTGPSLTPHSLTGHGTARRETARGRDKDHCLRPGPPRRRSRNMAQEPEGRLRGCTPCRLSCPPCMALRYRVVVSSKLENRSGVEPTSSEPRPPASHKRFCGYTIWSRNTSVSVSTGLCPLQQLVRPPPYNWPLPISIPSAPFLWVAPRGIETTPTCCRGCSR